jgi:hypothetical protein
MPYTKEERRAHIDDNIENLIDSMFDLMRPPFEKTHDVRDLDGDLNYAITRLLCGVLDMHLPKYTNINTAIGILACIQKELYRRVAAPYEDKKCEINGDVF